MPKKKIVTIEGDAKHPVQPLVLNDDGVVRFKPNKIVVFMLDAQRNGSNIDMNLLAMIPFPQEDREQFAQLIGYSLGGFGELSYVSDEAYNAAAAQEVYGKQTPKPTEGYR